MPDRPPPRLARGPHPGHHARLASRHDDARVLDPSRGPSVPGVNANPTTYLASRLMVAKGPAYAEQVAILQEIGRAHV